MNLSNLTSYEVLREQALDDIHSEGAILRHKKSGARVVLVSNDDDNKVFFIGFRTPPKDETGVAHIIEHTVLCGSTKYPAKDPFIELAKGSLNTFVNAMTYPEKTVYPIASTNDKDFQNLMDVYLDAVFHPNIYLGQEIFKQEGWHYEMEDKDSDLTINGVVYNEMKGDYSSSDSIMHNAIVRALFPDNTYGKDSGGNPDFIPELTYEDYLNFHRKYYSPANSYIYLYGDMDMEEKLEYLDKEYLSAYDIVDVDSTIPMQEAFSEIKNIRVDYPISSEESEKDNAYLSYTVVAGDALDKELYQALDILCYALVSVPGAPLKTALIDAGIGMDVSGGFDSGSLQPVISIDAKNANAEDTDRFVQIIRQVLTEQVKNGIDRKALLAGINSTEFRFREADFGRFPKGLLYGLQMLDSWNFDDMSPFLHIQCLDTFAFLKKQLETDYFEKLVQKYLLDNTHGVVVTLVPKKGLASQNEGEHAKKLAEYKASLSEEEIAQIVADTKALKEFQEEPSPKEVIEMIPMLTREDIRKKVLPVSNIEDELGGIKVLRHEVESYGINYMNFMFDARDVAQENIPYLGILKAVLSYMDTDNYSYGDLSNEINIYTGGIGSSIDTYVSRTSGDLRVFFSVNIKTMEENLDKTLELFMDFIHTTHFEDEKRLKEIISQSKSRKQISLSSGGNTTAAIHAGSGFSKNFYYMEAISGIKSFKILADLDEHFEEKKADLIAKLKELCTMLFTKERLLLSFTGTASAYQKAVPTLEKYLASFVSKEETIVPCQLVLEKKNEGFVDASQIQYVAKVGNYKDCGFEYSGKLQLLSNILSYDYLWIQIRVLGGAYGAHSSFYRNGEVVFTSYRDPNLTKTIENYDGIGEYLRNFDVDDRDMTKYIIGTFGESDRPLYPEAKGQRSLTVYMTDTKLEDLQKERDSILHAKQEDVRELADLVEAAMKNASICVIGNEEMIRKESDLFDQVISLN